MVSLNKSSDQFIVGTAGKIQLKTTRPGTFLPKNALKKTSSNHAKSRSWVVISHPHPQFGGTMENKVVTTLVKAYQELGFGTVIYNFRGVGESEGEYAGGDGEQEDLIAVVKWLRQQESVDELVLAGFSFGSYITLSCCNELNADAICTVAPPVSMYNFADLQPSMPWVLIQGGEDEVIEAQEVYDWVQTRETIPNIYWRAQASHFFHRQLIWVREVVKLSFS